MDGHIVGSMISANSITGEQIQANSIKTANLELSAQQKIQNATDVETVKALIKADLDGFESTLSKEFITVENATTQIQQATEVAVKEATQSIIDNAVTESMGAVDGQLNDKLNQYTGNTLLPAIAEKAEEVLQNAEDYVVTKLESYATKQELSSSISQTREQIELSVSEKYTTKTESATIITEAIDGITVGAINRVFGTGENKSFKFNGGANETWLPYKFSNDISDKEVYVSFNYTLTGTAQNGSQIEFAPSYLKKANNQTVYRPKHVFFTSNRLQDVNITNTVSFTTKDFQDISPSSTSYIRFVGNGFTGTLSISEVQIKPGNSKTSWSPAPEDTISDINDAKNEAIGSANNTLISTIANHYTKSETDSKISVAKDEINLGVSNTYETKTNVETKVASTLNSAKSYADTKKNEAISSANNTLNTTIANYYTKNQTDSQINVAKNAITQSVSNTYETKTEVTNKINAIQVGSRNWVQNSAFKSTTGWSFSSSWSVNSSEKFRNNNSMYINRSGLTANSWSELRSNKISVKQGDKLVGSWYIKHQDCDMNSIVELWGYKGDGSGRVSIANSYNIYGTNTNWTRYVLKGTVPANVDYVQLAISHRRNGLIYAAMPQVEYGNTATDWSPAPEDMETTVSNLTQRVASAESKITDSAITNTVKQNFYTKEETNNQITSKGYQTESQVQQTVNAVKFSFQESGGYNLLKNSKWDAKKEQWTFTNDSYVSVIEDAAAGTNYLRCQTVNGATHGCSQTIKVEKDNTYVASAKVDFDKGAIAVLRVQVNGSTYYAKTNQASQYRNKVLFVSFPVTTSGDAVITSS